MFHEPPFISQSCIRAVCLRHTVQHGEALPQEGAYLGSLENGMKEPDERTAKVACPFTALDESRRLETRYLTAVVEFVLDNNKDSTHPRTWVT